MFGRNDKVEASKILAQAICPNPTEVRQWLVNWSCEVLKIKCAKVAELADAPDLGSGPARGGGSSPPFRTKLSFQRVGDANGSTAACSA